jgi:hypothetical protein
MEIIQQNQPLSSGVSSPDDLHSGVHTWGGSTGAADPPGGVG